jgi:hypothetical protein
MKTVGLWEMLSLIMPVNAKSLHYSRLFTFMVAKLVKFSAKSNSPCGYLLSQVNHYIGKVLVHITLAKTGFVNDSPFVFIIG